MVLVFDVYLFKFGVGDVFYCGDCVGGDVLVGLWMFGLEVWIVDVYVVVVEICFVYFYVLCVDVG